MGFKTYHYEYHFDSGRQGMTWAVQTLILITSAVFAVQLLLFIPLGSGMGPLPSQAAVRYLGFSDEFLRGFVWQPVTYLFLHAALLHLFMNMLWLFLFGPEVERVLGTAQFYRFYFLCGALGVMASLYPLAFGAPVPPVIGASGAVSGVLIAFAMVNPDRQFFLFPLPIPINARGLVAIVIVLNIISAWNGSSVSVATHFGGMVTGLVYMKAAPRVVRWWKPQWRWKLRGMGSRIRPKRRKGGGGEDIGEAVDKILKFHEKKWRE